MVHLSAVWCQVNMWMRLEFHRWSCFIKGLYCIYVVESLDIHGRYKNLLSHDVVRHVNLLSSPSLPLTQHVRILDPTWCRLSHYFPQVSRKRGRGPGLPRQSPAGGRQRPTGDQGNLLHQKEIRLIANTTGAWEVGVPKLLNNIKFSMQLFMCGFVCFKHDFTSSADVNVSSFGSRRVLFFLPLPYPWRSACFWWQRLKGPLSVLAQSIHTTMQSTGRDTRASWLHLGNITMETHTCSRTNAVIDVTYMK